MAVLYWVLIAIVVLIIAFLLMSKKGKGFGKKKEVPQGPVTPGGTV
jgi:preprotein translocase subunit SecG